MTHRRNGIFAAWIAAALAAPLGLSACEHAELSGPPVLRLGRDECAECGMSVSDERYAGAYLAERDGVRSHLVFDDIGCMLDYQAKSGSEVRFLEGFVHDRATKQWVPAVEALFVVADRQKLPTPMGSGMAAFATEAGAASARSELGGEVMRYPAIVSLRKEWKAARGAVPGAGAAGSPSP